MIPRPVTRADFTSGALTTRLLPPPPSLGFGTKTEERLFVVFGGLVSDEHDLVSNDFKLTIFLNFRFYKKSNRTAQSSSFNARYGVLSRQEAFRVARNFCEFCGFFHDPQK